MKDKQQQQHIKYLRAKHKVEEIKKYYGHLSVYLIVNLFISCRKVYRNIENGESLLEAILAFDTFTIWFFWGIGLAFHTFKVFGFDFFLGKDWEQRKIQEYLEK